MESKSSRYWLFWLLVACTAGGALVTYLACLVVVASSGSTGAVAGWGFVSACAVAFAGFVGGLILQKRFGKSVESLLKILESVERQERPVLEPWTGHSALEPLFEKIHTVEQKLAETRKNEGERALQQAREDCREALDRLIGGMIREVQKPLAGIAGFADMAIKRAGGGDGQLRNYLSLIEQEARQARAAIERISMYLGDNAVSVEKLELNGLVAETTRQLWDELAREGIELQLNTSDQQIEVMADEACLRHVLSVLIQNAREAIDNKGTIEVGTKVAEGQGVVYVRDSGLGMDDATQRKLYTPFFTDKKNVRGAGLSLWNADSAVRAMGGRLEHWSAPGKGSMFFVYLPLAYA